VDAAAVASLRRLRGDERTDLYSKLVDLFQAGSAQALAQLAATLDAADLIAAAAVCHKFASSAANVGASAFARDVRQLERLCAAGEAQRAGSCTSGSRRRTRSSSKSCRRSVCEPAHERRARHGAGRDHRRR